LSKLKEEYKSLMTKAKKKETATAATPQRKEYEVTVLSRREITIYPRVGEELKQLLITYVAAGLPPETITIDKEKWTLEKEKAYIRERIEKRLKEKPETYKV